MNTELKRAAFVNPVREAQAIRDHRRAWHFPPVSCGPVALL